MAVARVLRRVAPWLTAVLGVAYVCLDASIYRSLLVLVVYAGVHLASSGAPVGRSTIALVGAVLVIGAMAERPDGTDIWIYQSYGRMVATHHANPYVSVPDDFADDPVMNRVLPMYRGDPSVYGPVLVAGSTLIASVSGESELAGRLLWQSACAIAVVAIAALLWRRRVHPSLILLVVSSPLVVYQFLNQAHNDVFIGLLVLVGCLAAEKGKVVGATLCFAAAALVKAPVGVAFVVYLVWLWARGGRRDASKALLTGTVFALVSLAPFGIGAALAPMLDQKGSVNATSIWNLVRGDAATFVWNPIRSVETPAGGALAALSMAIPIAVSVVAAWHRRARALYEPMSIALLAWFVLALHPSVWYLGWIVPLAPLWSRRTTVTIVAYSSVCLLVNQSWLMPVAARLSGDGRLDVVDRLAASGLGICTVFGVWLVAHLMRTPLEVSTDGG